MEPWQTKAVEEILRRRSTAVEVESDATYVQIGLRSHGKGIFHKQSVTGKSLGNKRVFWVQPDYLVLNIVFAWEQAVGKTTESENGLIASHRFPMYEPKGHEANIDFIVRFFLRPRGKYLLGIASPGGAGRNRTLGQKEFDKLKIIVPKLPEQQKIADFLTAVDGRIQQLIQKKALLEGYKKGVMQQLFSNAIRFKDHHGNTFPDWESTHLSAAIKSLDAGVSTNSEDTAVEENKPGILKTSCVSRGFFDSSMNKRVVDPREQSRLKEPVTKDSIIISRMNTPALDGKSGYSAKDIPNLFLPDRLWAAKLRKGASAEFVAQLLTSYGIRNLLSARATGTSGSMKNLTKRDVLTLPVDLPIREEQIKIANFLSAIDRKIQSVATQITETQTFKRGLLQQMFV